MDLIKNWGPPILILLVLLLSFSPQNLADETIQSTDISTFPYKQKFTIPIDTSNEVTHQQPIDIRVDFDSSCWAENQTIHSVRIGYGDSSDLTEIESQIYDLSYTDDSHIDACSIVFLIPEDATGDEEYYLVYSDQSTDPPDYPDHFKIKDTHYFYEPISGQVMDFDYFQIIQDDFITYAICQRGELLGNGMSNTIIKLLPESTEFKTKNAEQIASFYMSYSIDPSGSHTGSQWATDIEKSILVDGNLMIRVQIKGISPKGNIQTDNIYTCYYCPTETKRINVNINHDVLNTVEVKGTQEREGSYCSLSTIKARSGTIDDMNLGNILPNIHIFNEDETIRSYDIPTDPSAHPADWLLATNDDEDLGSKAWFCMDDPQTGQVHGLIFDKQTGFLEGTDDGIQVKSSVHQHVKLPGLEADSGDLYALRNAYENGEQSTTLSEDIFVDFNVVYVASPNGGYQQIDSESPIFQSLIKEQPIKRGNQTSDEPPEEEIDRYTLTVLVHNAPSMPLGSLLSAATGRNVSFLSAELYKDNSLTSSGSAQRLQLGDVNIELEGKNTREKIQTIRNIFDLRNSTVFKSVRFPDLEPGTYLVKIFKENPMFGSERKYVGFKIIEVTEDTRTHLYCGPDSYVDVYVVDQDENPIEDINIAVLIEDIILSNAYSDEDGYSGLPIPFDRGAPFMLQGVYDGFLVFNQDLSIGILNRWKTKSETIMLDLYDLTVKVTDTLGLPPAVNPNPLVTSENMVQQTSIQPSENTQDVFTFIDLFSNSYQLKMSYKSFEIDKNVDLDNDVTLDIVFPAEFTADLEVLNAYGLPVDEAYCSFTRQNKGPNTQVKQGETSVVVPPGPYEMEISGGDEVIASQIIEVKGDKSLTIISSQGSMIHLMMTLVLIIGGAGICIFLFLKQKKKLGLPCQEPPCLPFQCP